MISLALAVALFAADPVGRPAPTQPACPWDQQEYTVYYPTEGAIVQPNASAFILVTGAVPEPDDGVLEIVNAETQQKLSVSMSQSPLPQGTLIVLTPQPVFPEGGRFILKYGGSTINFSAGALRETVLHEPVLLRFSANSNLPFGDTCQTEGLVAFLEPDDAQLHFAIDEGGNMVGISNDTRVIMPVSFLGEKICVKFVSADGSGRRSPATEPLCEYPSQDLIYSGGGSGCACSGAEGARETIPFGFALLLAGLLFLRTGTIRSR